MMFWCSQTFYVNGKFTELYHIFCARIDFLLFLSAHIIDRELQSGYYHFGFVICVNSRLYCMHFSCHWRKICNVSRRWTQISKRQHDPCPFDLFSSLICNLLAYNSFGQMFEHSDLLCQYVGWQTSVKGYKKRGSLSHLGLKIKNVMTSRQASSTRKQEIWQNQ